MVHIFMVFLDILDNIDKRGKLLLRTNTLAYLAKTFNTNKN